MIRFLSVSFFIVLSVIAEIMLADLGIVFPLIAPVIFYTAYVSGFFSGITAAVAGGMFHDFAFGFNHPWSAFFLLTVAGFAFLWLYRMESTSIPALMIPGVLLTILYLFPLTLILGGFGLENLIRAFSDSVVCAMVFSVFMPVLIILLDSVNERIGLGVYGDAKERLVRKSS